METFATLAVKAIYLVLIGMSAISFHQVFVHPRYGTTWITSALSAIAVTFIFLVIGWLTSLT